MVTVSLFTASMTYRDHVSVTAKGCNVSGVWPGARSDSRRLRQEVPMSGSFQEASHEVGKSTPAKCVTPKRGHGADEGRWKIINY